MFRRLFVLSVFLSIKLLTWSGVISAQVDSYWSCYLKRQETTMLAKAKTKVFALADGALYAFSPKALKEGAEQGIELYDKTNGLNDVSISHIAYNKAEESLFIYYENGAIDLLRADGTYYINAIKEANDIRQKKLKQLEMQGNLVYFSGDFGLSVLDLSQNFIEGTFFRNQTVESFALDIDSKRLFALVDGELYQGNLSDNLQDPSAWQMLNVDKPIQDNKAVEFKQLTYYKDKLLVLGDDGLLYQLNALEVKPLSLKTKISKIKKVGAMLYLWTSQKGLLALQSLEGKVEVIAEHSVLDVVGDYEQKKLLLLYSKNRVAEVKATANGSWQGNAIELDTDSPFDNKYFDMRVRNGVLYSVNGGRHTNRLFNKGVVQIYDGIKWTNLSKDLKNFLDPVSILPHYSGEKGYCYVGTWGEGLFVFRNGKLEKLYDTKNSALVSALGAGHSDYVRVGSLTYDNQNTLWSALGGGVMVSMTKAGKWQAYSYGGAKGTNSFTQQIAMPNGIKWVADYHKGNNSEGLFVYDTKGTVSKGDDISAHYSDFLDRKAKVLSIGKIKAMALDRQGVLWLGSSIGYCSLVHPSHIPQGNNLPRIMRPIGGDEPPYYYVLDKTPVSAIAVDNLNRKWLGTEHQGLYLVSADGLKVLEHYSAEDSPLLDNEITSLAFDSEAGLLYIGTNKGLNSLKLGTDDLSQTARPSAIAYPNPLRPEDPDIITFEGLPAGAKILVFDSYGHQVLSAESFATTYRWKVYQSNGKRLAEGVYFAHIYAPSGDEIQEIKLAIIGSNTYH